MRPTPYQRVFGLLKQAEALCAALVRERLDRPAQHPVINVPRNGIPLREIERLALIQALVWADGRHWRAAALLDLSPRQMTYKIQKYGLHEHAQPPSRSD